MASSEVIVTAALHRQLQIMQGEVCQSCMHTFFKAKSAYFYQRGVRKVLTSKF